VEQKDISVRECMAAKHLAIALQWAAFSTSASTEKGAHPIPATKPIELPEKG
jgi:hypothetical protein